MQKTQSKVHTMQRKQAYKNRQCKQNGNANKTAMQKINAMQIKYSAKIAMQKTT